MQAACQFYYELNKLIKKFTAAICLCLNKTAAKIKKTYKLYSNAFKIAKNLLYRLKLAKSLFIIWHRVYYILNYKENKY